MPADPFDLKRIAVAAHPKMPEAVQEAALMAGFLSERGLQAVHAPLDDEELRRGVEAGRFDLLVAVGGDGTVLRAGHLCAPCGLPILGVNLGRLGFLIQVSRDEWAAAFTSLLDGDFWVETRMMLRAELWRGERSLGAWHALNEVVVCRGRLIRPVHLAAIVDGRYLTSYVADGLIAATPTGSTAYALAAGGPILPPELRNILLVPIAPHLSVDRAVVLSEGSAVEIILRNDEEAVMSVDGQPPLEVLPDDRVEVRAGDYSALFVRFGDPGYFYRNLTAHMNQNPSIGMSR
jgi:NAD+ kinase